MPVRNEERYIGTVLQQLLNQSLDSEKYEILVVDGQSTDKTRKIVQAMQVENSNVQLLNNPDCLSSSARNVGSKHARGQFVLFVDGHCNIVHNDMLEIALEAFLKGERCVSRPQPLVAQQENSFSSAIVLARHSLIGHGARSMIYNNTAQHCSPLTAGCGYELGLYWELGGVDESFDAAEDLEFNYRVQEAGVDAYHSEKFSIEYIPRNSMSALFRQLYRYGYGRGRMTRKHPVTFSFLTSLLGVMGLFSILLPLIGLFSPAARLVLGWCFLPYLMITAIASLKVSGGQRPWSWLKVWSVFPAIHFGAGIGYIMGLVRGPAWSNSIVQKS